MQHEREYIREPALACNYAPTPQASEIEALRSLNRRLLADVERLKETVAQLTAAIGPEKQVDVYPKFFTFDRDEPSVYIATSEEHSYFLCSISESAGWTCTRPARGAIYLTQAEAEQIIGKSICVDGDRVTLVEVAK